MKILFTSDLHGDTEAYAAFVRLLRGHDCGIIAGDLLDEFIPMADARAFGLVPDDGLEELPGEDVDEVAAFEAAARDAIENPRSVNRIGLGLKRQRLAGLLSGAGKTVYFVRGNHDIGEWPDDGAMVNIENRIVRLDGVTIVGLEDRFEGVRSVMVPSRDIARAIGRDTIVVSHAPPFGVMDSSRVRDYRTGRVRPMRLGSRGLRRMVRRRAPRYCLFGHVHEGFGVQGNCVNGSWPAARRFISLDLAAGTLDLLPS